MSPYLEVTQRPLWEALAQRLARAKPGDSDLATLNRVYWSMNAGDQLRCKAELHAIRQARRGQSFATVENAV